MIKNWHFKSWTEPSLIYTNTETDVISENSCVLSLIYLTKSIWKDFEVWSNLIQLLLFNLYSLCNSQILPNVILEIAGDFAFSLNAIAQFHLGIVRPFSFQVRNDQIDFDLLTLNRFSSSVLHPSPKFCLIKKTLISPLWLYVIRKKCFARI